MSPAPEGINEQQVTEWMAALLPELRPPLTFTLVAGGRSNLTFRVEDADGRAWALRRPPLHHVLPTAHDMTREYRLIHSLGPGRASRSPWRTGSAPTRRSTSAPST